MALGGHASLPLLLRRCLNQEYTMTFDRLVGKS